MGIFELKHASKAWMRHKFGENLIKKMPKMDILFNCID